MGVLAQVVDTGQSVRARAGVALRSTTLPVPFNAQFRTGSNTKMLIAATLLHLEGQGKLSLDDKVDKWLPGEIRGNGNDGRQITVRQLLNHTSGLFDYTEDQVILDTLVTPEGFMTSRFYHYTPHDLVNIALAHAPNFAPGTSWAYSNTNYIVAGQVIEAVTGKTWDIELKKRITDPLGMIATYVPGDNPVIMGLHAEGYHIFTDDPANRVYTNTTLHNMTWADAAGAVVTTTADESRFINALFEGKVLKPAQLNEMLTLIDLGDGVGSGLGILHQSFTCPDGSASELWGHTGQVMGYITYLYTNPSMKRSVIVSLSTSTFSDADYGDKTTTAINELLFDLFCPGSNASATPKVSSPSTLTRGLNVTKHSNRFEAP